MKVSVSVLSNEIKPQDIVKKLDLAKPDYIHIDIMDGKFVSNKTWTTSEVKKFTSYSTLPLKVHLMVKNPSKYIEDYALMNTSVIIFHYEAVNDINEMINKVKSYGLKVGIAINPETNIDVLLPYLNIIDEVLGNILKELERKTFRYSNALKLIPAIGKNHMQKSLLLGDYIPTRQLKYSYMLSRLDIFNFL